MQRPIVSWLISVTLALTALGLMAAGMAQTAEAHRSPAGLPKSEFARMEKEDPRTIVKCGLSIWWKCEWGLWAFKQRVTSVGHHGYHVRTWGWESHLVLDKVRVFHVTTRYIHDERIRARFYADN